MNKQIRNIILHLYFLFCETLIKININPHVGYYVKKSKILSEKKLESEAVDLLEQGIETYPDNYELNIKLAKKYFIDNKWGKSSFHWGKVFKLKGEQPLKNFHQYTTSLKKCKKDVENEEIIKIGLFHNPTNRKLLIEGVRNAIRRFDWEKALSYYETLESEQHSYSLNLKWKQAMLYQVVGQYDKAKDMYKELYWNQKSDIGYTKLILFNNGESRIEFYKQHNTINKVCITFDSINITWNQQPFAFTFLLKENVDIIAVRRKKSDSYQQDLSLEDFVLTVQDPVEYYGKKISYGFSLGAYSALYYSSSLNCDILAISPRNSMHPFFGKRKIIKEPFKHQLYQKINPNLKPVIAYDPKNTMDNTYVENELKRAYPNGSFMQFPYVGHRIAPYFRDVGLLKYIVQAVIHNQDITKYKKVNNSNSHQYLKRLGNVCLKRNKYNWALKMGEKASELSPKDFEAIKLIVKALMKLGRYQEALETAEHALKDIDDANLDFRETVEDLKSRVVEQR